MTANGIEDADRDAVGAAPNRPADAAGSSAPSQPSWLASLQGLAYELPGLISDRIELLSLEVQRAGQVLAQIIALIVAAAILAVTAWLALWGGVIFAVTSAGLHWATASLLVIAINLGACWWAVARARSLTTRLDLPATRRHLTMSQASTTIKPLSPDEHTDRVAVASVRAR